jgi:hypothetical protein
MSYSYAYNPKVSHPHLSNDIAPLRSGGFQTPFFFGAAQTPNALALPKAVYNGSQGKGFHKGSKSISHKGDLDFTTKRGDLDYHQQGHLIAGHPYGKGFHKGSVSLTHPDDMDFTTKKGDLVYHRKGHNIKMPHSLPFSR